MLCLVYRTVQKSATQNCLVGCARYLAREKGSLFSTSKVACTFGYISFYYTIHMYVALDDNHSRLYFFPITGFRSLQRVCWRARIWELWKFFEMNWWIAEIGLYTSNWSYQMTNRNKRTTANFFFLVNCGDDEEDTFWFLPFSFIFHPVTDPIVVCYFHRQQLSCKHFLYHWRAVNVSVFAVERE